MNYCDFEVGNKRNINCESEGIFDELLWFEIGEKENYGVVYLK